MAVPALLEVAERALESVPPGVDGAQATASAERSLTLRFARSRPTQATSIDDVSVLVTVVRDGHVAAAGTNRSEPDALAACAAAACAAAEAAARMAGSGAYPGLPDPAALRGHGGHDPATARLDPSTGGAAMAVAFEEVGAVGAEAHGSWSQGEVETAVASSAGLAVLDRVTDAALRVSALEPGGRSGMATAAAFAAGGIDARAVARRAAAKVADLAEPARLEPGEYPVVLEAPAVAEVVDWVGRLAFDGLAYAEGRSAVSDRLGRRVAAPSINLSDSPRFRGTLPRAFDAEGVPKNPLPLIQDGVAHRVVHDTRSAALAGASTTGHALVPGGSGSGAVPTNLVLVGGGAADEAELCRPIERGVYVTRFWYTNPVRPREGIVTGTTRDGTFLIEDGQVTRPLEDLRLTDSVLGVLERTQAMTSRLELVTEVRHYGRRFATGVVCPALRASSLRFTG